MKAGEDYGNDDWTNGMDKYLGRVVTIEGIVDGCDKYKIQGESRWTFTDEMFEGLAHIKAYDLMKAAAKNPQKYEGRRRQKPIRYPLYGRDGKYVRGGR